jgi:asparagine synthase (glutamine-hydrolysing)
MCGIAGLLDPEASTGADRLAALASAMAATLEHRGPDDRGVWVDPEAGLALSHQRLAVIDLGPGGAQPMTSAAGRWVLSYNGEVYNYREIRRQVEAAGAHLRGASDTEALLAAVELWGIDQAIDRCEGMFAAGLWDKRDRELHLIRDRFGEKPLYYGWVGRVFAFGSELKALSSLPGFSSELNRRAVVDYLGQNCIPAPETIWRGIRKLMPGHLLTVKDGIKPGTVPTQRCYWSAAEAVARARANPLTVSVPEMIEQLEEMLSAAVAARMVADVPVGAFLSGGIDSSSIVALMQQHASTPVRTFTVGFADRSFDESAEAAAVAAHLGTDHTAVHVGDAEAVDVIAQLPDIWDEPFSDVSQIPTYLVSRVARQAVTVSLSGDGGDELFAGYNRHAWVDRVWGKAGGLPAGVRRAVGSAMERIPPGIIEKAAGTTGVLPANWRIRNPSTKVVKLGRVLAASDPEGAYRALTTHWADAQAVVLGQNAGVAEVMHREPPVSESGIIEQMLWFDLVDYLPNDILVKVDRAAMAVSLETRVPFLDRRLLEFAWSLPLEAKLREGQTKWLLRRVLDRHVPPALVNRPKMGFGLPIGSWLRGPLGPWAEQLLGETRLRDQGLLDPAPIRRAWELHRAGRRDLGYELWDVLVLQSWIDRWKPRIG